MEKRKKHLLNRMHSIFLKKSPLINVYASIVTIISIVLGGIGIKYYQEINNQKTAIAKLENKINEINM